MSEPLLPREVRRRLAIIQHAEEVTGNVAMTCRYYGISRPTYYTWLRRYREQGVEGLRDLSRRPRHSPNATHADVVGKIIQTDNGAEFQSAFHYHVLDKGVGHRYIKPRTPRLNG
ncbi:helix-turn-helix domain-containing protein [Mycolicibacterium brumae]|uniref:helix-turn-helix domain-containing protein n=1 Tax=Mycolicibacterium brumae TaxID=85968 RepID=UPI000A9B3C49|nr:helix-turn-helix domain-containing protein [Mycolicibacterium brumae]RWA16594.1 hypothetical protein MBRU_07670 [Mycolicibacterium brumae DSM 44177]